MYDSFGAGFEGVKKCAAGRRNLGVATPTKTHPARMRSTSLLRTLLALQRLVSSTSSSPSVRVVPHEPGDGRSQPTAVGARNKTKALAYSVAFKASMIRKITGRGAVAATALADELGFRKAPCRGGSERK